MTESKQVAALESLPDVIELIAAKKKQGHPYLGCFIDETDISFNTLDPMLELARAMRKRGSMLCLDHRHGAVFVFEEPGVFKAGSKSGWATQ